MNWMLLPPDANVGRYYLVQEPGNEIWSRLIRHLRRAWRYFAAGAPR